MKEHGLSKTNDIAATIELSPARTRVLLKEMSDVSLLRQADEPDQRPDLGRQQIFAVIYKAGEWHTFLAKDSRGSRAAAAGAVQVVDDETKSSVSVDPGCSTSPVLQNLPLTKNQRRFPHQGAEFDVYE